MKAAKNQLKERNGAIISAVIVNVIGESGVS